MTHKPKSMSTLTSSSKSDPASCQFKEAEHKKEGIGELAITAENAV